MDISTDVEFPENADGWLLEQEADLVRSVQAFWEYPELSIELWGTTTLASPAGKRYEDHQFQQNVWIQLITGTWLAHRIVYGVVEGTDLTDDGVEFTLCGGPVVAAGSRRI
jgi:hypothetical protein